MMLVRAGDGPGRRGREGRGLEVLHRAADQRAPSCTRTLRAACSGRCGSIWRLRRPACSPPPPGTLVSAPQDMVLQ